VILAIFLHDSDAAHKQMNDFIPKIEKQTRRGDLLLPAIVFHGILTVDGEGLERMLLRVNS
jgi:hypothetical protein